MKKSNNTSYSPEHSSLILSQNLEELYERTTPIDASIPSPPQTTKTSKLSHKQDQVSN